MRVYEKVARQCNGGYTSYLARSKSPVLPCRGAVPVESREASAGCMCVSDATLSMRGCKTHLKGQGVHILI